jgi:threonine dehydratase
LATAAGPSLADVVRPTTIVHAPRLARRLGIDLHLASETFQHTGSFKFRAAYNVAASVPQRTLLTASSGNFGQALAHACARLGKRAIVVMPTTSARVKLDAVRAEGGEIELVDPRVSSRARRLGEVAAEHPEAYVASAYDDPLVIAGNASLGSELAALPLAFDAVLVPVGGGGLSSGIVTGLAAAGHPARVWGAEPQLANDAARSLAAGQVVANDGEPMTIADGARTPSLGRHNWEILRRSLAGIVEVPEAAIREAVRLLFALANLKAEPTGALGVGALLAHPDLFAGSAVCCVVSGGNVDPAVYREILGEDAA